MRPEFLVQRAETLCDPALLRISLHDLLIFDHFVRIAGFRAAGLALRFKVTVGTVGDKARQKKRKRRQNDNGRRDQRVHREHENERRENGEHTREKFGKAHQKAVRKPVHVLHHPADKVSRGMRVQIGKREHLNMGEQTDTEILRDRIDDLVVENGLEPAGERRCGDRGGHLNEYRHKAVEIDVVLSDDEVDRLTDEDRKIQSACDLDHCQKERKHCLTPAGPKLPQHFPEGLLPQDQSLSLASVMAP